MDLNEKCLYNKLKYLNMFIGVYGYYIQCIHMYTMQSSLMYECICYIIGYIYKNLYIKKWIVIENIEAYKEHMGTRLIHIHII